MLELSALAFGLEPWETIRGKLYPTLGPDRAPALGQDRVESLRTVLRFEEALGLRVKLITQNGIVIGPFQEGNKEADQGLLQA